MLLVRIKKLDATAEILRYAHEGDAGLDIFAAETLTLAPGARTSVATGIAMEIPEGYVGLVWDKSGLSHKHGLKTLGGVIDAGFRGEVRIGVVNLSGEAYTIEKGHKIAQILFQKVERAVIEHVDELSDTSRGEHGFGSTGK